MIALIYLAALGAVFFPITVTGCAISASQIKAYYGTGDGLWRIRLAWSSENPDCKVHLHEQVDGKEKFQIVESKECVRGKYCYFKTSKQCCSEGKMKYKYMKFSTNCSCHFSTFIFTIKDLLSGNPSHDCRYILPPGNTGRRTKAVNMEYRECGYRPPYDCYSTGYPNDCPAGGCYCKDGYGLNKTTGLCTDHAVYISCPIGINLQTPECVKLGEPAVITWEVDAHRQYTYTVKHFSGDIIRTATVSAQDYPGKGFVVTNNKGYLFIPSFFLGPNNYTIKVVDITSYQNNSEQGVFSIKAGCKPPTYLGIDARDICQVGTPTEKISWSVQANRTYMYTISRGGQIVKEDIVPGSGNDGFLVDNGRGQLRLKLEPGDYTVTVQDLDAGVNDYYTETMDFSVKGVCPEESQGGD